MQTQCCSGEEHSVLQRPFSFSRLIENKFKQPITGVEQKTRAHINKHQGHVMCPGRNESGAEENRRSRHRNGRNQGRSRSTGTENPGGDTAGACLLEILPQNPEYFHQ